MVVERNRAVFTEAPTAVPDGNVDVSGGGRWKIWQNAGTKIDAPILGNGDLLAAVAGDGRYPQFWFTTNDFWQMESAANWEFFHDNSSAKCDPAVSGGSPRPVGRMVFDIPAMEGARWYTEQEFAMGETITILTNSAGEKCSLRSWVAADENILVVEFESETDLDVEFDFYFPDETGKGCEKAVDVWGSGESENVQNGMFVGLVTGRPLQVKKTGGGIVSGYRHAPDDGHRRRTGQAETRPYGRRTGKAGQLLRRHLGGKERQHAQRRGQYSGSPRHRTRIVMRSTIRSAEVSPEISGSIQPELPSEIGRAHV